jgi:hypothetical protein
LLAVEVPRLVALAVQGMGQNVATL